ncbi:methyltransferase domain-containing protein [Azospirillum sp. SYSU D00513]|uniref:methyltransferase domain-containing protein n=1 Tax=Azospirillum sp. SYSU D00513 TaxID=2812561 RepID=UPI001A95CCF1|nr:methyltransferase domain-containing protein [Azospirillum sp. SYSU D00513]
MHDVVKSYYGETLQGTADLKTNACCSTEPPAHLKPLMAKLHEEVVSHYYGCGLVCPPLLDGMRVLDLGSGSGRDCFLLSALVGESGAVTGVDMTEAQVAIAERHRDHHRRAFGHARSNVDFRLGYIERLGELGLPDNSFDVIVSNCVINLSPDKESVLREARRVLKPGGELYFADVYSDRRVPKPLRDDPVLYGECLSGALYWNDFVNLAKACGFLDPRLVEDRPITLGNAELAERVAPIRFFSATYRLFKLEGLEPACEDYGQAVRYKGTIPQHPRQFPLDKHHLIDAGRIFPVCGNTYRMLNETRFRDHFDFLGDWDRHFGLFPGCGGSLPFDTDTGEGVAASCC